jgi:manganese/iron transport system ATP-binding protein/manganese/zinc/iron transport system ATP- binding protein
MLMDEPLTGLDAPAQEGLLDLLDTLKNQNVAVMVATHDLEQAARHFDRIMLLNRKIVAFGSPSEVLRSDKLLEAYGGRLRPVDGRNGLLAIDDTCEDEGSASE